ncbi:hypothetical protein [Bradyrhizobium liaoningense]
MLPVFGTLIVFASAMVAHAIICRLPVGLNIVFRFVIVGGILGLVWTWWLYDNFGLAPPFWAGVLVYGLYCELYVFLFTFAMSSISANLLVSLSRRAMTAAEIEQLYDSRAMVSSRIDRLVAVGLFDETPAGLELTAKGVRTVRTFGRLRAFFRHPPPVDLQ